MKASRRAQSRRRHYQRMHKPGGLNLVSLMDIFTILVFFLMVNSSDVKVLRSESGMDLPQSTAEAPAADTLTVLITTEAILLNGREVARLADIPAADDVVADLANHLRQLRPQQSGVPEAGFEITVLAEKNTQYRLLRKIMQTCVEENYRQVRLAVRTRGEVANG
ncbi:ExbD/TolR family protein [Marinobacter sp. SS21]|uniref:ExbD/TolR family protein n=1 Tax=Marinobacter sp. SS21 TaxID=2979460 RepID=UPI00232D5316|nr:biopolymer transporter ExbD [Marinobacter sp. SS21]MDC0661910.1 biopolymer transporter ExbD [Marinobacter sp. SS21]